MSGERKSGGAVQLAMAGLLLLPLIDVFWSAGMTTSLGGGAGGGSGAARWGVLMQAAARSIGVGLLSAAVAALIGIPAAWWLAGRRMTAWRTALVILPLALPVPVAISGWVRLVAPNATSSFALQLPGAATGVSWAHGLLFSIWGAGIVLGLGLWPVVALNAWPGFLRARDEAYEAARLYATPAQAFFRAVLPRSRGEIAAGLALVFILASNDFAVSSLLLVNTLTVEVHDLAALGKNTAAAWAALPLVLIAALLSFFLMRKTQSTGGVNTRALSGLRPSWNATGVMSAGVALGFMIPVAACGMGVLTSGKALSVSFDAGAGSMGLSVRLGAAAVLLSLGFAAVRVLVWAEHQADALNRSGLFLLAMPGGFLGVAVLMLQINATKLASSFQAPLAWMALGLALRFVYVPLRLADEALTGIDAALLESAALLGHGRMSRAFAVALPMSLGHLAAAGALVFALAMGEVPVASILAPPGATPATIWLFAQQHMGYDESVFALSLLLGGATAGIIGLGALGASGALSGRSREV